MALWHSPHTNHCPYFVHKDVVLHSSCYWPHYFSLHAPFTFKETGLTFYHLLPHAVANCFFTWIAISGYEHGSTGSKVRLHSTLMTSVWGSVCGTYIQDLRQILCTERNPPNSYAYVWQHWVKFLKILIHLRLEANPSSINSAKLSVPDFDRLCTPHIEIWHLTTITITNADLFLMKNLPDWNLDPRLCIIQSWQTLICVCLRRGQGSLEIPHHHVWCKQWKQKSGVTNWATKALETEHATIIVVKAFPPKDSSSTVSDKHFFLRDQR